MSRASIKKSIVDVGPLKLEGILRIGGGDNGLIIFAHGAGSSRLSPRNNYVAELLAQRGFATLLFDLLTEEEARDRANVFDIPRLSERVVGAVRWARSQPDLTQRKIGLFGASTGAAAALVAAADVPEDVAAVVSRGGRPDLAGPALARVEAPTLLVVGGADFGVIELNEQAARLLNCEQQLAIVPGATHLFEEPGALARVVTLAGDWFSTHLQRTPER